MRLTEDISYDDYRRVSWYFHPNEFSIGFCEWIETVTLEEKGDEITRLTCWSSQGLIQEKTFPIGIIFLFKERVP